MQRSTVYSPNIAEEVDFDSRGTFVEYPVPFTVMFMCTGSYVLICIPGA